MAHKIQMYENLRDMLEREVGEIERKRDLDKESLDNLFKLTASLKVVDKCIDREEMEEMKKSGMSMDAGMSGRYSGNSYGYSYRRYNPYTMNTSNEMSNGGGYMGNSGNSYDMSQDGMSAEMSGRRRGRDGDNDGRYNESRDNFRDNSNRGRSYADGNSYEYSRDASRKKMVQKLETLMDDTMSEHERKAIQDCITKIEK